MVFVYLFAARTKLNMAINLQCHAFLCQMDLGAGKRDIILPRGRVQSERPLPYMRHGRQERSSGALLAESADQVDFVAFGKARDYTWCGGETICADWRSSFLA